MDLFYGNIFQVFISFDFDELVLTDNVIQG